MSEIASTGPNASQLPMNKEGAAKHTERTDVVRLLKKILGDDSDIIFGRENLNAWTKKQQERDGDECDLMNTTFEGVDYEERRGKKSTESSDSGQSPVGRDDRGKDVQDSETSDELPRPLFEKKVEALQFSFSPSAAQVSVVVAVAIVIIIVVADRLGA